MATEDMMMAAVQRGADRQEVHEIIRRHAQAAAQQVKSEGAENDLLERLGEEEVFRGIDLAAELDPKRFTGRAARQVDTFIAEVVQPIRRRYKDQIVQKVELKV
jgi:adenylosuccinate lyase